jgi:hypothetical protein
MYRRAIVVVFFAAAAVALLMKFPGPLFGGVPQPEPTFSNTFSDNFPMDFDDPKTVELRAEAKSAMNDLIAMSSQKKTSSP